MLSLSAAAAAAAAVAATSEGNVLARVCVSVRARASACMNEPPSPWAGPTDRSTGPPLVNRPPGGKPTVARVGGPAGRPYYVRPPPLGPSLKLKCPPESGGYLS